MKKHPIFIPRRKARLARSLFAPALAAAVAVALNPAAIAANASWTGTSNATWSEGTNWSSTPVPGTGDTATFDSAGNANTILDLGGGVTANTILFDTSSAAAYTVGAGSVNSQTLTLNNAGAITVNATVTNNQLFNAGIVLGTDGTAQTTTFSNNSTTNSLTIAGDITGSTGSGAKTLAVPGSGLTTISGNIVNGSSGTVKLTKSGTGTLALNGANTFTGTTSLTGGTLSLGNADAVKNSAVTISNGTTLQLRNNSATSFSTSGAVALSSVASQSVSIDVNNIDSNTGNTLTLANGISYVGPSSGILKGTYTTSINVTGGNDYSLALPTVTFGNSGSYGSGQPRNFVLALNPTSANLSVGSLTLTGSGQNVTVALTLNGSSLGNNVTGTISLPAGRPVTKNGSGTWTLSGTSNYTGATTVNAGTLLLDGGGSLASAVSVTAGTFGGNGTVNGTVAVAGGATLEAGASLSDTATLSLANNLTLSSGSIIAIGLGSSPTTHDILARTGGTWSFQPDQAFTFLDQGAVGGTTYTGIITGLAADPGVGSWTVTNSGWSGTFSYNSGSIDFAYLAAVPEPGTWLLVGIGLTFMLYRKRSRRFDDWE